MSTIIIPFFKDSRYMTIFKTMWQFFGIYQTKAVRINHIMIVVLVISQIIISNGMSVTADGSFGTNYQAFFTWLHIAIGCLLLLLLISLIMICFQQKGFFNYYPYLLGDFKQIKHDLVQLSRLQLPDSNPRGVAAVVQGAGLAALSIVMLSGILWFILWLCHNDLLAYQFEQYHKILTGLIEIYVVGHGGMAVLHFIKWLRQKNKI